MTGAPEERAEAKLLIGWLRRATPEIDPVDVATFATAIRANEHLVTARKLYVIRMGQLMRSIAEEPVNGILLVKDGLPLNLEIHGPDGERDEHLTSGLAYVNLRILGVTTDNVSEDAAINGFTAVHKLWHDTHPVERDKIGHPLAPFVAAYLADGAINTLDEMAKLGT